MIICSSCGNGMENELRFCTECGAENPTLEPTTLVSPRVDGAKGSARATPGSSLRPHDNRQSEGTSAWSQASYSDHISPGAYAEAPAPPKRSPLMVIALVAGAVVLLLVGGIASRLLFDNNHKNNSLTTTQTQTPAPTSDVSPTTKQMSLPTPSPPQSRPTLPQPIEQPQLDTAALTREVEDTLNGWAAAVREHNLERHLSYYGDTVNPYYSRRGASASYVRSSRTPAFTRFQTLDVQLNNIAVTIDPSGTTATSTFGKTYRFEGDKVLSGSVQQMVWLTKISGSWRITGERDMRVYYLNR